MVYALVPRVNMLILLFAVGFLTFANATSYPSTFPYENEEWSPPALLVSTPSGTMDDSDPGGYYLRSFGCDLNDPELKDTYDGNPYAFCNYDEYAFYVTFGVRPREVPISTWNCSGNGLYFKASDYSGVIAGSDVCKSGSCCKEFHGFFKLDDSEANYEEIYTTRADAGLCPTMTEPAYCLAVAGYSGNVCLEYFSDVGARPYLSPCAQTLGVWLRSCDLYKSVGVPGLVVEEPLNYQNRLSPEQTFTLVGASHIFDRVCLPQSYYFPDVTKQGSDAPASTPDDDDSASTMYAVSFAILALMVA